MARLRPLATTSDEDGCSSQQAAKNFAESGGNLKNILAAVIKTDSFMYKKVPGGPR